MIIDIDITEKQTDALSQVLKRIGYTDIRALSQDDAEARGNIKELIISIQDKIKLRGRDENSIF